MKRILTLLAWLCPFAVLAANTVQTNGSTITGTVTISSAVDYTLTASTPFSGSGYVNITNTDHAVVIFKTIKPSVVISTWLKYVRVNGSTAVNGTNCQVKMYDRGTIVLPYASDMKPLTCYTGQNYSGTSCTNYGLGNTDGYMNTLTSSQLLNQIRSFKLKRGYMVTFAVGTAGWGYSRCFIADKEDLEMATLPAVLDGKISSYRIFKWQDAKKSGLANDITLEANGALNSSWCYNFNVGADMTPDQECVPHRIQTYWPGIADIGKSTYSANMKTDNEPANSSDDNPATVSQVLGYWQDVMRTGMRLCSPSAHDGGYTWLNEFMTAIDARGWRCDVVDVHCYWIESQLSGLASTYNTYKRPIWISELLWGASWNSNGIFAAVSDASSNSSANQTANYNGAKPMLDKLNSYGYVERYAWWNSENVCSNVYYNGALTTLGNYYATMDPGIGYNKNYEFVPKVVISTPATPTSIKNGNQLIVNWTDANGDMVDKITVQYKALSATNWSTLGTVTPKDKTGSGNVSYSATYTLAGSSNYMYRIVDTFDGTDYASGELTGITEEYMTSSGWITSFPSNYTDFYYLFYSSEAATDLCWTLGWNGSTDDISYQTPKTIGTDLTQVWQIEANTNSTGYSLRNLGAYDYVMCSPYSWNFITNNASYHVGAACTGYLPEYHSEGYWTVANCNYSGNYVGLWDNDKVFAVGERLAGNRNSIATADHLKIYAVLKSEFNGTYIPNHPTETGYLFANQNFTWGTYSSSVMGSGANSIPNGWSFEKQFSGWNDSNVATETINGVATARFNTWAAEFTYADFYQQLAALPNGVYHLTADMATTENFSPYTSLTAIYAIPSNTDWAARSYDIAGTGVSNFNAVSLYVVVDDKALRVGARSDGTWFKVANFKLQYLAPTLADASDEVKREVTRSRALQRHHNGTLTDVDLNMQTEAADAAALSDILLGRSTDSKCVADQNGDKVITLKDIPTWVKAALGGK